MSSTSVHPHPCQEPQIPPQEIARVERTQEAVAAGNFQEPAGEIADALIDSALSDAALGRQARAG